ncbi:MAG: PQQ-binding-like beta-propeller repeat protein [Fimbriimonas sp.]
MLRILTVGLGAIALAPVAAAQFDGPAPLAWRFIQPTRVSPAGSPLVVGDRVYQSIGGRVVCIDRETGNLKFRFPAIDPIPGTFRSSPVVASNGIIVAAGDNKIAYGFDAETGDLKWSYNLPGGLFGQPVAVGKYVVMAQSDNKLVAVDVETGQMAWQNPFNILDGINGTLAAYRNSVVLFTNRNELVSLDVTSLKYDWKRALSQVPPNATPVVFGEDVFLVSGGYLVQINASTGLARWQIATGQTLNLSPTASAAGVMVISQDGKALVYDPIKREAITKKPIDLGTLPIARATAVGEKFVVPTTIGGLVLVDPKTGVLDWNYLIRPIGDPNASTTSSGPGGPGRGPGGGGPGGFGGPGGSQNQNNDSTKVVTIQPSASPVLAGTTLLVPAKDGSILAFDRQTGVDLTGPKVDMLFPNPGDQVSGQPPLLLLFKIEDIASGIKNDTLKIEAGGQVLDYTLQRDGRVVVRFSQTGKNRPLGDGRKEIVVTVTDWLGNQTKQTYALTIDNTLAPIKLPGTQDSNQGGFPGAGGLGGGGAGGAAGDGR